MKNRMLLTALLLASVSLAEPSVDEELIGAETALAEALHKRDHVALEKLMADEYLGTDASGRTYTKAKEIADSKSGFYKVQWYKLSDLNVHVYGDVATVTGMNTIAAEYKGRDVGGRYRFTDVFVKRDGRWQCVLTHSSYMDR